jgi:hypothetical protein
VTVYLTPRPETIPPELQAGRWVLWRAEPNPKKPEKPRKVPYQIAHPERKASSTDPATWGRFDDAVEANALLDGRHRTHPRFGPIAGIGVILTAATRITCIDLDGVVTDDTLDPRAARVVRAADSWTEVSPSGTGVHIFVGGTLPEAVTGDQFEAYATGRFIAVTGHRWPGTPAGLHDRQSLLDRFVAADQTPLRRPYTGPTGPPPDDLGGALLEKVRVWRLAVVGPLKRWQDGFLLELARCPWDASHTTGPGGAAILIHASGAFDFTCRHSHCGDRGWRDFRAAMEPAR